MGTFLGEARKVAQELGDGLRAGISEAIEKAEAQKRIVSPDDIEVRKEEGGRLMFLEDGNPLIATGETKHPDRRVTLTRVMDGRLHGMLEVRYPDGKKMLTEEYMSGFREGMQVH